MSSRRFDVELAAPLSCARELLLHHGAEDAELASDLREVLGSEAAVALGPSLVDAVAKREVLWVLQEREAEGREEPLVVVQALLADPVRDQGPGVGGARVLGEVEVAAASTQKNMAAKSPGTAIAVEIKNRSFLSSLLFLPLDLCFFLRSFLFLLM